MASELLAETTFRERLERWEADRCSRFRLIGERLNGAGWLAEELWRQWRRYECHPLFHALMDLFNREAGLTEGVVRRAVANLGTIPVDWSPGPPEVMRVEQNRNLLPEEIDLLPGVHFLRVDDEATLRGEFLALLEHFGAINPARREFISRALRVVTFLRVEQDGDYFSGSSWAMFGAAHLSSNMYLDAIGEMLVHEAEHARLHLLELQNPFLSPSCDQRECFYSPWRADPRPLYGVFHGVHVFASVTEYLLEGLLQNAFGARAEVVGYRLALLRVQVERALEELDNFADLTASGRLVIKRAKEQLSAHGDAGDARDRARAQDAVHRIEAERKSAWAAC